MKEEGKSGLEVVLHRLDDVEKSVNTLQKTTDSERRVVEALMSPVKPEEKIKRKKSVRRMGRHLTKKSMLKWMEEREGEFEDLVNQVETLKDNMEACSCQV